MKHNQHSVSRSDAVRIKRNSSPARGLILILLCCVAFAISAINSLAGQIIMGTGTEWGHWRGQLSVNGVSTNINLYQVLQDSQIPTQLEKTYLNDNTNMSHFQDLLNHGVSPVMLEENKIQGIYRSVYPTGNDWDSTHVWNSTIQTKAYDYLNNVIAPRIAEMKKVNFNGLNMYYVLNPEFVFIGDCKTSSGYAQFCLDEINMLRAANLPGLVIVRGFLVNYGDFNSYLPTIQNWAGTHATELSEVDYFGPEFNNEFQINATVASNMIPFLATVKSYTGKLNFIPNSYLFWNTTDYSGNPTGSDADGAAFWNYLHANRDQLENNAGVVAWCLSATLERRGGSGLVEPQLRPTNFNGYVYPFALNGTYNQGGIAFANWLRDESPYQIMNVNSGLAVETAAGSSYIVQDSASWQGDQQWVPVQLSNGYYLLQNKQSGLVLGTENDSTASGALIVQKTYSGQWNAMWEFVDAGNGNWKIRNRKSGLLLSVVGDSTSNGARLEQHSSGSGSQLWRLNINIPANTTAPVRSGLYYYIQNATSGLVINGEGNFTVGSAASQWARVNSSNLRWQFISAGSGYYYIQNQTTGLYLDGAGYTSWGSSVLQWNYANSSDLQWSIVSAGNGRYYVQNRTTGLVLDGRALYYNGAPLGQWGIGNSSNLQWQFN